MRAYAVAAGALFAAIIGTLLLAVWAGDPRWALTALVLTIVLVVVGITAAIAAHDEARPTIVEQRDEFRPFPPR